VNATTNKSISDMFLELVKGIETFDGEAQERILKSVEEYDRPYIDRASSPSVLSVSKWGSISITSFGRFVSDPWNAKNAFKGNGTGYEYFIILSDGEESKVFHADETKAGLTLYGAAKAAGFPAIPVVNNVTGYMVSFDELRGSIPEFMREAFEKRVFDETVGQFKQPHVDELRAWYDRERDTILGYLRSDMKRVKITNKDTEEEEWVDVPIKAVSFGFNRFDQPFRAEEFMTDKPERAQATANFSVSDNTPGFNPPVSYNWHCQDTSRWIYAGCIAINYTCNKETGEESISISTHH